MKNLIMFLILGLNGFTSAQAADTPDLTYGIHLFFNETEFVDVLTLKNKKGQLEGEMDVPNDFKGPLKNIQFKDKKITFDLFVPKNSARPRDLIFHYEGQFFDKSRKQLVGYVTLKDSSEFVASFVGFLR